MVGVERWQLLGKVPLQSFRVRLINLYPNEYNMELVCSQKLVSLLGKLHEEKF